MIYPPKLYSTLQLINGILGDFQKLLDILMVQQLLLFLEFHCYHLMWIESLFLLLI